MPMPKTTVYEDDGTAALKNDVGLAGKGLGVKSESEASSMQH